MLLCVIVALNTWGYIHLQVSLVSQRACTFPCNIENSFTCNDTSIHELLIVQTYGWLAFVRQSTAAVNFTDI